MPKVFIVSPDYGFPTIFKRAGWEVSSEINNADMVQFTGGQDINPALYGQKPHPSTYFSTERDKREVSAYNFCKENAIPMAGVCRGAQLFTALTGGHLWQDVDNHMGVGMHKVFDSSTGEDWWCNSVHHQMMVPNKNAHIIAYAKESSRRDYLQNGKIVTVLDDDPTDPEVVYFPEINSMGFQGHPEMGGYTLQKKYFDYIAKYMKLSA